MDYKSADTIFIVDQYKRFLAKHGKTHREIIEGTPYKVSVWETFTNDVDFANLAKRFTKKQFDNAIRNLADDRDSLVPHIVKSQNSDHMGEPPLKRGYFIHPPHIRLSHHGCGTSHAHSCGQNRAESWEDMSFLCTSRNDDHMDTSTIQSFPFTQDGYAVKDPATYKHSRVDLPLQSSTSTGKSDMECSNTPSDVPYFDKRRNFNSFAQRADGCFSVSGVYAESTPSNMEYVVSPSITGIQQQHSHCNKRGFRHLQCADVKQHYIPTPSKSPNRSHHRKQLKHAIGADLIRMLKNLSTSEIDGSLCEKLKDCNPKDIGIMSATGSLNTLWMKTTGRGKEALCVAMEDLIMNRQYDVRRVAGAKALAEEIIRSVPQVEANIDACRRECDVAEDIIGNKLSDAKKLFAFVQRQIEKLEKLEVKAKEKSSLVNEMLQLNERQVEQANAILRFIEYQQYSLDDKEWIAIKRDVEKNFDSLSSQAMAVLERPLDKNQLSVRSVMSELASELGHRLQIESAAPMKSFDADIHTPLFLDIEKSIPCDASEITDFSCFQNTSSGDHTVGDSGYNIAVMVGNKFCDSCFLQDRLLESVQEALNDSTDAGLSHDIDLPTAIPSNLNLSSKERLVPETSNSSSFTMAMGCEEDDDEVKTVDPSGSTVARK